MSMYNTEQRCIMLEELFRVSYNMIFLLRLDYSFHTPSLFEGTALPPY